MMTKGPQRLGVAGFGWDKLSGRLRVAHARSRQSGPGLARGTNWEGERGALRLQREANEVVVESW